MSLMRNAARLVPLTALLGIAVLSAEPAHAQAPVTPEPAAPGGKTPPPTTSQPPGGATPPTGTPPIDTPGTIGAPPGAKVSPTGATAPGTATAGGVSTAELGPGSPLTSETAAARTVSTSKYAAIDEAKLRVAAAQVDAAWDAYLPRLTLSARYTRLSPITPPSLGGPPGTFSVIATGPGVQAGQPITGAPGQNLIAAQGGFTFPVILDQYVTQASLLIPISDYVFRIHQNHAAALQSYEAAKWNGKATLAQASADARVAYYNWLRALGSVLVARAAVGQADAHLKDMKHRLDAKVVTIADVARVEANLAAAQLAQIRTEGLVMITDANLHMLMHAAGDEHFLPGEDLEAELPKISSDLPALQATAMAKRPELKAIDAQINAGDKQGDAISAGLWPRLDAIGNVTYANPNQRFIPQSPEWKATWDVSLQLSWSPNDWLVASDNKKVVQGNVGVLKVTRESIVDALHMEVVQAYVKVREAEASIVATKVELRAAEEAHRVRKEQFTLGTTTSALLIDAEADVTRARLNHLNARVDLRIARVQLRKAVGEF